jgi:hypothetical protein
MIESKLSPSNNPIIMYGIQRPSSESELRVAQAVVKS